MNTNNICFFYGEIRNISVLFGGKSAPIWSYEWSSGFPDNEIDQNIDFL